MNEQLQSELIVKPRRAYRIDGGKYVVVGGRPYSRDGKLMQSAAADSDLATALKKMEEHESQFLK